MDKLYAIKIRQSDGTYGAAIPVSVLAENVDWNSTLSLVDILGQVDTSESIQDQINNLKNTKATQASVNALDQKVDNAVEYITHNSEIADAREGADGTEYSTLKERLDSEYNDLDSEYNNLRSDIVNVSNKVIHKNILLISDSYGGDDSAGGTSWETIVANRLTDRNVDKYYWGGHAFGDSAHSLPDKIATIPASDSVDYILILCGANDGNRLYAEDITTTDIGNGISAAVTTMRTNFPNAEIHIGFVGRYRNAAKFNAYRDARNAYKDRCLSTGVTFADNFEYILHDRNLLNSTDLVHPTAEGSALIGNYAIQYILNGSINVTYRGLLNVPIGSTSIYLDVKVKNAMTLVTIRGSDMGAVVTLPRSSIPASSGWIASAFTLNSAQYIINIAGDRNGVVMGYGSLSSSTDGYDTAFTATLSDTELDIFNRRAPGSAALTAIPTVYVMFSPIVCDTMIC